ncbi:10999_t:CDS:1, partial [Gigaspora margarita]
MPIQRQYQQLNSRQNTKKNLKQRLKSVNMVKPTMTKKAPNN